MEYKKISNHFNSLGGLKKIVAIDHHDNLNHFVNEITNYCNKTVPENIISFLKIYQGCVFVSDKNIGFETDKKIPVLGNSNFIDFTMFFTLPKSDCQIVNIFKNNDDIFSKSFLPIAEAIEGDFITINLEDECVYFISHDFNEKEQYLFKIADSIETYSLGLKFQDKIETSSSAIDQKIVKVEYKNDFLKKMKEFKVKKSN